MLSGICIDGIPVFLFPWFYAVFYVLLLTLNNSMPFYYLSLVIVLITYPC